MLKKNLIGIVIVLLVFAGFYTGYVLGKGSGGTRVRPGMPGAEQAPTSPHPSSDEQIVPQNGDVQWVKSHDGEEKTAPSPSLMTVAWAEPIESSQEETQASESAPQGRRRRADMAGDETTPQQRPQAQQPMAVTQEEQASPEMKMPLQKETSEETLTQAQDDSLTQTFYGTVVPYAEANVQSKQGGTITLLKGKEGELVKKGDVLVRFDDRDTQLQLQQAIASKNSAVQQVNQAESNFQTIQANVKRYQELFEDGFVSKQEVDDLQHQLTSAISSLNSAKESVKQNEVQVQMIENTLRDFQVRAPIGGLIEAKNYNLSEIYQGGGVIYHLIYIDRVYVEVEVPETYLKQLREGMAVSVVFDAVGEQPFSGTLETILPSGASDNRSFTAKVLVQNSELSIKPGMFARIEMSADGSTI